MDAITHALVPVLAARLSFRRLLPVGRFGLIAIGLAGALPDLLNPHFTLEERMESWSHGLPFWLLFTAGAFALAVFSKRVSFRLSGALSAVYLLHLLCDAVSGGVNWLCPVRELIWGDYWIHPLVWPVLDVVCVVLCYVHFRYLPMLARQRAAEVQE